ncbi:hypothetical protein FQR65_LT08253 [Abscondita terminalis]|nr:hypothetical protein FQR65_LT08253 [Abscondita terminalis]
MSRKFVFILINLACASTCISQNVSPFFDQCLQVPEYGFYQNRLNQTIECYRSYLITGIPERGVPSFDPLKSNLSEINIDNPLIYTDIKLKDVEINGLTDFEIKEISSKRTFYPSEENQEYIEYYFKFITFDAEYKGKANFFGLTSYAGKGRLVITLKGVSLETTTSYQTKSPMIKDFHANVHVGNATVYVSGVQGGEDLSTLVSVALSRMMQYIFDTFPERVSSIVNEMGLMMLNKLYEDIRYEDYRNAILTSNCKRKL